MRRDREFVRQPSLLDAPAPRQEKELRRVSGKIATHIAEFFRRSTGRFHMTELHEFVVKRAEVAPASCDRVMRDMRKSGQINYRCINRGQSLYEVIR